MNTAMSLFIRLVWILELLVGWLLLVLVEVLLVWVLALGDLLVRGELLWLGKLRSHSGN